MKFDKSYWWNNADDRYIHLFAWDEVLLKNQYPYGTGSVDKTTDVSKIKWKAELMS